MIQYLGGDSVNNKHSKELCHSQFQGNEFQGPELYHHGILGMHWGIRRYQPYGHGGYEPDHIGKNVGEAKRDGSSSSGTNTNSRKHEREQIKTNAKQQKYVKTLGSKDGVQKLAKDKKFHQFFKEQAKKSDTIARNTKNMLTFENLAKNALDAMFDDNGRFDPHRKLLGPMKLDDKTTATTCEELFSWAQKKSIESQIKAKNALFGEHAELSHVPLDYKGLIGEMYKSGAISAKDLENK